jgi:subtilisin family serine protease
MRESAGNVALDEGFHSVLIEFFEKTGGAGMIFKYKPPSSLKQIVPSSALFHGSLNRSLVGEVDVAPAAATKTLTIAQGTSIPETASHLLAYSVGSNGESLSSASTSISDKAAPTNAAGGVAFQDVDSRLNYISGNITITRASTETDITDYVLYYGTSSNTKQDTTPIATLTASVGGTVGSCGLKGYDGTPYSTSRRLRESKILNGQLASGCEWKWQVSLRYSSGSMSDQHFCGGTLIGPTWVLTSASCVAGLAASELVAVLGDYNKDATDSSESSSSLASIHRHPQYTSASTNADYNMAILELSSAVSTGYCVGFACLPSEDVAVGTQCDITGWGVDADGAASGTQSSILQEAEVSTMSNENCGARTGQSIGNSSVCAVGTSSVTGSSVLSCNGDNGGPLVCRGAGGRYFVHGAFSWGPACSAPANQPAVYARVWNGMPWIDSVTGINAPSSDLVHTLSATQMNGATHLLVFTAYNGMEMTTGVSIDLQDWVPPSGGPQAVAFVDTDPSPNELQGTITISRAGDESSITHYVLYWGNTGTKGTLIAEISSSASNATSNVTMVWTASDAVQIPSGMTHILAFSKSSSGESESYAECLVTDLSVVGAPGGIEFEDEDDQQGIVSGTITIQRASSGESQILAYLIYWGQDAACTKLADYQGIGALAPPQLTNPTCSNLRSDPTCSDIEISAVGTSSWAISRGMSQYRNSEQARIDLQGPGTLTFDRFDTERGYDYIELPFTRRRARFSGAAGSEIDTSTSFAVPDGVQSIEWYSDGSIIKDGWALTYSRASSAGDLSMQLPASTALPSGASHLLVFSQQYSGEETANCAFTALHDKLGAPDKAQAMYFEDQDNRAGQISGTVTITQARNALNIASYKLIFASGITDTSPAPGSGFWNGISTSDIIAELNPDTLQDNITYAFPADTVIPLNRSQLAVYSVAQNGETSAAAFTALVDNAPPATTALSIEFCDTEPGVDSFGGTVTVTQASTAPRVRDYNVYWSVGSVALERLGSVPQSGFLTPTCTNSDCDIISITKVGNNWQISRGMSGYSNNEFKTIQVHGPAVLTFSYFNTEQSYDFLALTLPSGEQHRWSGQTLPSAVTLPQGTANLHWMSDGSITHFGWICSLAPVNSATTLSVQASDVKPAGATHLLVLASGDGGEATTGLTTPLVDFAPPIVASDSVSFVDMDMGVGTVGGTVTIVRAADDVAFGVTAYDLMFGESADQSTAACTVTLNAAISGHNIQHLTGATVASCTAACHAASWCKSFDFYRNEGKCDLSDKSASDVGGLKTDYAGNPYDHYDCAANPFPQADACSSFTLLGTAPAPVSGSTLTFTMASKTALPAGVTHLLVFASGSGGMSQNSTSVEIRDRNGITFTPAAVDVVAAVGEVVTASIRLMNADDTAVTVAAMLQQQSSLADASMRSSSAVSSSTSSATPTANRIAPSATETPSTCAAKHASPNIRHDTEAKLKMGKNRVLFKWKHHVSHDTRRLHHRRLADIHNVIGVHDYRSFSMSYMELGTDNVEPVLADLARNTEIEWAEEDQLVYPLDYDLFPPGKPSKSSPSEFKQLQHSVSARSAVGASSTQTPDDSFWDTESRRWGFHNDADTDIDAPEAWHIHTGNNRDVIVAVIDTGVNYNHPDLVNRMWTNPNEIPGNGIDDDNNGYVDDVYGYDFHGDDGDPMDDNGHGTHCAGIIGAEPNNGIGIAGVSWGAKIMALRFLGPGGGSSSDAIRAIDYAVQMGVKISSNSWGGGGFSNALSSALDSARAAGHLFVAAAGNDGRDNDQTPSYPSNYEHDNIISVGSSTNMDERSSFSNWGLSSVDIFAPGSYIYSTYETDYAHLSGTSMATPFVSGAAALLWDMVPALTYDQLRDLIISNGDEIDKLSQFVSSGKRLNVHSSLQAANMHNWVRIKDSVSSVSIPANGEVNITLELGGQIGEYGASLVLSVADHVRSIPVSLTVHSQSAGPASTAQQCVFEDLDVRTGYIKGALTIVKALSETDIARYDMFFADPADSQLAGWEASLEVGTTFRDEFVTFDSSIWQPPDVYSGSSFSSTSNIGAMTFQGTYENGHLGFSRQLRPPFTAKAMVKKTTSAFVNMMIQIGGSQRKLFNPGESSGGIQAFFMGSFKNLMVDYRPGLSITRYRNGTQCSVPEWFTFDVVVTETTVSFEDQYGCMALQAEHHLGSDDPLQLTIGSDCTGACTGVQWEWVEVSGSESTYTVPANTVLPSSAHSFLVKSWNPVGHSSQYVTCTIADNIGFTAADQPTAVTNSAATQSTVTVSWTRPALHDCSFRDYEVMWQSPSSGGFQSPTPGCAGPFGNLDTTCTATGLSSATAHSFKVRVLCNNAGGDSPWSDSSAALSTLATPASPPRNVETTQAMDSSMLVNWWMGETNDCQFVETVVKNVQTGQEGPTGCTNLGLDQLSCQATGLSAGTSYEFEVQTRCANAAANSAWSFPSDALSTAVND